MGGRSLLYLVRANGPIGRQTNHHDFINPADMHSWGRGHESNATTHKSARSASMTYRQIPSLYSGISQKLIHAVKLSSPRYLDR